MSEHGHFEYQYLDKTNFNLPRLIADAVPKSEMANKDIAYSRLDGTVLKIFWFTDLTPADKTILDTIVSNIP